MAKKIYLTCSEQLMSSNVVDDDDQMTINKKEFKLLKYFHIVKIQVNDKKIHHFTN